MHDRRRGAAVTCAHDDPAIAAARAFGADLLVPAGDIRLPAEAGLRTKLLERDLARLARARQMLIDELRVAAAELESIYGDRHATVIAARRALTLASLA